MQDSTDDMNVEVSGDSNDAQSNVFQFSVLTNESDTISTNSNNNSNINNNNNTTTSSSQHIAQGMLMSTQSGNDALNSTAPSFGSSSVRTSGNFNTTNAHSVGGVGGALDPLQDMAASSTWSYEGMPPPLNLEGAQVADFEHSNVGATGPSISSTDNNTQGLQDSQNSQQGPGSVISGSVIGTSSVNIGPNAPEGHMDTTAVIEMEEDTFQGVPIESLSYVSITALTAAESNGDPLPDTLEQFVTNPSLYRPRAEWLSKTSFIEEETILTYCIKHGFTEAVMKLLQYGSDPNLTNTDQGKGVTPISTASHKGHTDIMVVLIEMGADVNKVNKTGSTALIQASHFGHEEAVRTRVVIIILPTYSSLSMF